MSGERLLLARHPSNSRMVRSCLCGGAIRDVSFALHEQAVVDLHPAWPLNANVID